ncbi:MAG: hypothetical protein Q9200_007076 [Gallowayella weberi]
MASNSRSSHEPAGTVKREEITLRPDVGREPSDTNAHNDLKRQAVKSRTVIGVVGHTGAGKSSVINAILDHDRLVPTSCVRACTAVVTEISHNHQKTPYRAEIEFIQPTDWEKELKTLFQDLLDSKGKISREHTNDETVAGIAYAKVKALYPKKRHDVIANSSIEKREIEFWPLVKVVRLYVKAPVLSTGAVIVDLPGIHDSNVPRAAVAEGYMKQTTGLWIVSPITRAVDDKAAKTLLGDSFRRQLKLDGSLASVTFICSKTDDISITEAQDSLGLEQQLDPLWQQRNELVQNIENLRKELASNKSARSAQSLLTELRTTKRQARNSIGYLEESIQFIRQILDEATLAKAEIESRIATACISTRNIYSKIAIQQDYASGIKELDQELAAEEDISTFNPDEEIRDYDEVARSLPVFCVSSRGYQKLKGRLKKDGPIAEFKNIHETEIPMLQEHCKKLTVAGRLAICRKFLNNLWQLLKTQADIHITPIGPSVVVTGLIEAGGGEYDWNQALAFSHGVPAVTGSVSDDITTALRDFHREVENRARKPESGGAGQAMLQHQVGVYTALFNDLVATITENISAAQRRINREITPIIQATLGPAYETCKQESGKQTRSHIDLYANSTAHGQIGDSVDYIREQLLAMVRTQEQHAEEYIREALVAIRHDYLAALGCAEVSEAPVSRKIVPEDIMRIIDMVVHIF